MYTFTTFLHWKIACKQQINLNWRSQREVFINDMAKNQKFNENWKFFTRHNLPY